MNALFGQPVVTPKVSNPSNESPQNAIKSPSTNKRQINFNFEDAFKAESNMPTSTNPKVQIPNQPNQIKNPMMNNNITKPPEQPIKVQPPK